MKENYFPHETRPNETRRDELGYVISCATLVPTSVGRKPIFSRTEPSPSSYIFLYYTYLYLCTFYTPCTSVHGTPGTSKHWFMISSILVTNVNYQYLLIDELENDKQFVSIYTRLIQQNKYIVIIVTT